MMFPDEFKIKFEDLYNDVYINYKEVAIKGLVDFLKDRGYNFYTELEIDEIKQEQYDDGWEESKQSEC